MSKIKLIFLINLFIFLFCSNIFAQQQYYSRENLLKSFPVWGGLFETRLKHRVEWILDSKGILKALSWNSKHTPTKVFLKDTEFANFDEEREDRFYYRGNIIEIGSNLDLKTRSFIFYKKQIFIYLNEINPKTNNFEEKLLFLLDDVEFVNIYNVKIYKANNNKEYLFIYLQSGEDNIQTGIYCYELSKIIGNIQIDLTSTPHIFIPIELRIFENWSISEDIKNSDNIILSLVDTDRGERITYLINYFLDFADNKFESKYIFSSNYVISAPKIIQNSEFKFVYFKKRDTKNTFYIYFGKLNDSYDAILEEYENGPYTYDTPRETRMNLIERDIGLQATWINEKQLMFTGVLVAHTGNEMRGAGVELFLGKFDIEKGTIQKRTMIEERPSYVYFNSNISFNTNTNMIEVLWVAEYDVNMNGYPDRDIFLTYGNIENTTFTTLNLSDSPRSEWCPQLIKDNDVYHYLWLVEHPKNDYQVYYRNNKENTLATIVRNLNLPLYGDNSETIFTLIFYIIVTIFTGIFEGTVLNGVILFILFCLVVLVYKKIPHISHNTHTIILLLCSIIISLSYGVIPLSFPTQLPEQQTFIVGASFGIISIILLDRIFYKKKLHTPTESCIKIWFFSVLLSIYINYTYISSFIVSDMVVRI